MSRSVEVMKLTENPLPIMLIAFIIGILVYEFTRAVRGSSKYTEHLAVAQSMHPNDRVFQTKQIGQFVRVEPDGKVYSFNVWELDKPKTNFWEVYLFNVNDFNAR